MQSSGPAAGINRRRFRRVHVCIPAAITIKAKSSSKFEGQILDISEGGAFVHCTAPIMIGDEVLVEIHFREAKVYEARVIDWDTWTKNNLPEESPEQSVVKWARGSSQSGFGIEFLDLKPDKKTFLTRLIDYYEQLTKVGVSFKKDD